MSLDRRLGKIDRESERTLTSQLVDVFVDAIEQGELAPGSKLPPTRALAELAGVNPLTASRVYRRLGELGLVVAGVGRGTFVRGRRPPAQARAGDIAWQNYALPAEREREGLPALDQIVDQAERGELIPLSVGYPPNEMLPAEQLSAATRAVLGASSFLYGPVEGAPELRAELAALGRRRGLSDDPEQIIVTTGARQAMTLVVRAVTRPGDVVACESPTFMGISQAMRDAGARVLGVPVDEEGLDVAALRQLLHRHEIALVALQSRVQNPTGTDLSPVRRRQLVELAREHGFFIVEDGVYADLRVRGVDPGPLRALAPEHVIHVDSLSKTVAPGLRTGWVAASGAVLDRIAAEKNSDDGHSPMLPQQAVARFLADGHYETQLARTRAMHRERLEAMVAAVERHLGDLVTFTAPPGGGHLWLTLGDPLDEDALYREAIAAGVSFTPGEAMLVDRPRETHVRLSFAFVTPEQIEEGVRRLAGVIRALRRPESRQRSMPLA